MPQLPTIEDVARVANVSRQTVSNVLNSPDIVKAETRSRVEDAISTLGYRVHASARRLRTRQSSTIGIRLDPVINGISGYAKRPDLLERAIPLRLGMRQD